MAHKKPEPKVWKPLGEPIHGIDTTNGTVDVTADREPAPGESEANEALRRGGNVAIGMGR